MNYKGVEYKNKHVGLNKIIQQKGRRIRDNEENETIYGYTKQFLKKYGLRKMIDRNTGYHVGYETGVSLNLRIFKTHESLKEYTDKIDRGELKAIKEQVKAVKPYTFESSDAKIQRLASKQEELVIDTF